MMSSEEYNEIRGSRLGDAIDLLKTRGEAPFSPEQRDRLLGSACKEVSMKQLLPTFLTTNEPGNGTLPINKHVLSYEIGGTNVRVKRGRTDERASLLQLPGVEQKFQSKVFEDPDHFFSTIVKIGELENESARTSGETSIFDTIFSYPSAAVVTSYGIDMVPYAHEHKYLPKGVVVPYIDTIRVAKMMWKHLKKQGLTIPLDAVMVVLNDTPAVALCSLYAHMGLVDGTGTNVAIALPDTNGIFWIYNTELGELTCFPLSKSEEYIQKRENIQKRHLEIITGGETIGFVLDTIVRNMVTEGFIPYRMRETALSAIHYSAILDDNRSLFTEIFHNFDTTDKETWKILRIIASWKRRRACDAISISIAAEVKTYPQAFPNKQIICPVEGSNFWKTRDFPAMVTETTNGYLDNHTIEFVPASGFRGAMFDALRRYNNALQKSG